MDSDLKVARDVLQKAPNEVITAIFNAALNGRNGAVDIPPNLIPLFRHHKYYFDLLGHSRN